MSGPEIDKSLDSEACILVRIWAVILYFGPKYILQEVLTQYHSQCYQLYLSDTPN